MRKKDKAFAKTEVENAKVLFDHFHGVVNCKELSAYDPTVLQEIDPRPTNTALDAPPTSSEIKAALCKMHYEKSPGKTESRQKASRTSREAHYRRSRNLSSYSGKTISSTLLTGNRLS
jgi:hypothetical protein